MIDAILMQRSDRIYVGVRRDAKEVWIERSDGVQTGSKGIHWESDRSPMGV